MSDVLKILPYNFYNVNNNKKKTNSEIHLLCCNHPPITFISMLLLKDYILKFDFFFFWRVFQPMTSILDNNYLSSD